MSMWKREEVQKVLHRQPEYRWQPPEPKQLKKPTKGHANTFDIRAVKNPFLHFRWHPENVRAMDTRAIFERLNAFGIPLHETEFCEQADNFESVDEFLHQWKTDDGLIELGEDADFPWLAFYILTERLLPDKPFLDHIGFWISDGYDLLSVDEKKASDVWRRGMRCIKRLSKGFPMTLGHTLDGETSIVPRLRQHPCM